MKRIWIAPLALAMTLALAGYGFAQSAQSSQSKSPPPAPTPTPAASETRTPPSPAEAKAAEPKAPEPSSLEAQLKSNAQSDLKATPSSTAIKEKGAKTSSQARSRAEAKLATIARKTDADAGKQGAGKVAERLAVEFGVTTDQLTAQQQTLGCSWGELMIAHSLAANSASGVTVEQLVSLNKEGTGWGQIAAGLGLHLGEVVSAAQAEGRVAAGLAKPDGKVAVIHGEGARAGVASNAGAQVGAPVAGGAAVKNKP